MAAELSGLSNSVVADIIKTWNNAQGKEGEVRYECDIFLRNFYVTKAEERSVPQMLIPCTEQYSIFSMQTPITLTSYWSGYFESFAGSRYYYLNVSQYNATYTGNDFGD